MELPEGVNCARGVCVIDEDSAADSAAGSLLDERYYDQPDLWRSEGGEEESGGLASNMGYLWPRALLLVCSVLYGTNFPLGRLMNEGLPASASTSARFVLAFGALLPFLPKLAPELRWRALLCGCFTALGYVGQSIALVDTPAATVSFLGCLTVVTCPVLSVVVDKKELGFQEAPQVWVAAGLALVGVGALELGPLLFSGPAASGQEGSYAGDVWSCLQAVGFGTSFFLTERMMAQAKPGQALPITAVQCGVTALVGALWAGADGLGFLQSGSISGGGWLLDEATRSAFSFPGLVSAGLGLGTDGGGLGQAAAEGVASSLASSSGSNLQTVAWAAAWTGLITTAGNRLAETTALGKVSSSEASVLLATEPLWAVVFATFLIAESPTAWDAVGGFLLIGACVANSAEGPLRNALNIEKKPAEAAAAAAAVLVAVDGEEGKAAGERAEEVKAKELRP